MNDSNKTTSLRRRKRVILEETQLRIQEIVQGYKKTCERMTVVFYDVLVDKKERVGTFVGEVPWDQGN